MTFSREIIRQNIETVLDNIGAAAARAGCEPSSVKLVVVTKTHPVDVVRSAMDAGAHFLGENYAEEGLEKIKAVGDAPGVEWHMIGHVQSRKADSVVRYFSLIHSLDSLKLAERINRTALTLGWVQPVLIQVNVSGEESKFGYPAWESGQVSGLVAEISKIIQLPGVEIRGLMTIPPFSEIGDASRKYFVRLRDLRDKLQATFQKTYWSELSMGMSGDYEIAVEEGATMVRVGTAILGARDYSKG